MSQSRYEFQQIVGATVDRIFWSEDYLILDTDKGIVQYEVYGDCCSHSYFHDFIGVKKLLHNGPIVGFADVDLSEDDFNDKWTYTEVYGYRFETMHPTWGLMSSVVSFRNESNGYYGGSMSVRVIQEEDLKSLLPHLEELTSDKIG